MTSKAARNLDWLHTLPKSFLGNRRSRFQPPSEISGTFRQKCLTPRISVHIPAYFTFCSLSKAIRTALQTSMF